MATAPTSKPLWISFSPPWTPVTWTESSAHWRGADHRARHWITDETPLIRAKRRGVDGIVHVLQAAEHKKRSATKSGA